MPPKVIACTLRNGACTMYMCFNLVSQGGMDSSIL